ncbi:MAG: hypothetical protein ACRD4U_12040, partial [Candidatus Acidiferrales bacterium]
MKIRPKTFCLTLISFALLMTPVAQAQTGDEDLAARLKALEDRVRQLEAELAAVRAAQQPPARGVATAGVTPTPAAPAGPP